MAITLADAIVYLRGDDSQLEKSIDGAHRKVGSFVGGATKLLGGALLGGATAAAGAILGIGTAAFDVSKQTEQATAGIAASLGITTEEARKFGEVARAVYGNNFADSVNDAGDAVAEVAKRFQLAADDPSLKRITENAFRLRDAFGVDVTEGLDAAQTLMENFGVSSDEAFNLIAAGYQKGLDRSGDFLDTIGEYSTQFANGGANADQFFSLLQSGLQGGVLGTDKAADAFKEFQVRILDGSKTTADGLSALGINADEFTEKLASGQMTTVEAFNAVIASLGKVDDQATLMQAGVGLLGTQFEDLGATAVLNLEAIDEQFISSGQGIDALDAKYATFGDAVSGIWRRLVVTVSPFTDKILELVNDAMPSVMAAFDQFDQTVVPAMENIGHVIDTVVGAVTGLFRNDLGGSIGEAGGAFDLFRQRIDEIMPYVQTIVETVLGAIQGFWKEHGETVLAIVQNTFDTMRIIITTALDVILQAIKLVLQVITGDWEGAGETLTSITETLWAGIKGIFTNQLDSIGRLVGEFNLADAGRAIVSSLQQGISDKWGELTEWFKGKLLGLRNMLPFSEPRDPNSPLRGLGRAGQSIVSQIQAGMDSATLTIAPIAQTAIGGVSNSDNRSYYYFDQMIGPNGDPGGVREAARRGVLDARRARGIQ